VPDTAIFAIEAPEPTSPVGGVTEVPSEIGASSSLQSASPGAAGRSSRTEPKVWGVAAIDLARRWPGVDYVDLGVTERSPVARHLYESLGFRAWGREPESLEHDGRRYNEIFMTLRIGKADKAPKDGS